LHVSLPLADNSLYMLADAQLVAKTPSVT
jgi:hypothetical protein